MLFHKTAQRASLNSMLLLLRRRLLTRTPLNTIIDYCVQKKNNARFSTPSSSSSSSLLLCKAAARLFLRESPTLNLSVCTNTNGFQKGKEEETKRDPPPLRAPNLGFYFVCLVSERTYENRPFYSSLIT